GGPSRRHRGAAISLTIAVMAREARSPRCGPAGRRRGLCIPHAACIHPVRPGRRHPMQNPQPDPWHATTILTVRKGGIVAIGGDGQVSVGQTIVKSNAKKVRRLGKGDVIGGFAGATADAFTLFERLEAKLEQYPGQLSRAAVERAKDWRTDRYLRRL